MQFWFEFASPYSYLTAMRIERAAADAGVEVEWRPFLLGPIFAAQGWNDSPFNLYPAKGRYMWREMERFTALYGLRYQRPSVFPRHTVLAARVACIGVREAWGPTFVRAAFEANLADDRDISDASVVRDILRAIGQDGDAVVVAAEAPENKARLRAETETARELGIFGAPSFVVADELFFGNDRLEQALAFARQRAESVDDANPGTA